MREDYLTKTDFYLTDPKVFLPGFSVDCVILAFQNKHVKILLNKFHYNDKWMLPGGFVYKNENVDEAAYRVLKERAGLSNVYLRQFYLFGDKNRTNFEENEKMLNANDVKNQNDHWFLQRFVSLGYYALVQFDKVKVKADPNFEDIQWFSLDEIPELYSDHNNILDKALNTIRKQIDYIPFGYELLPPKFVLSELRVIYEALLGKQLDRRNFQRKIMSLNLLDKLNESKKEKGKRSTTLYSFNKERYKDALENGISLVNW